MKTGARGVKGPIATAWASYLHNVVPSGAHESQKLETRLAFYSGAVSLMDAVMRSLSDGAGVTEADMCTMKLVDDELKSFKVECLARARNG